MSSRLAECRLFFTEFRRSIRHTGALTPSGQRLSATLARYVACNDGADRQDTDMRGEGRRILEVGPGTGAVTRHIVRHMRADDRLDLVEINERFAARLQDGFRNDPALRAIDGRATVHCARLEELPVTDTYDLIISGLPLNNFTPPEVENILGILRDRAAPGAIVSFFEYMAVRPLKSVISGRHERARLRAVGDTIARHLAHHEIRRDPVWGNLPPAWVHHLQF